MLVTTPMRVAAPTKSDRYVSDCRTRESRRPGSFRTARSFVQKTKAKTGNVATRKEIDHRISSRATSRAAAGSREGSGNA